MKISEIYAVVMVDPSLFIPWVTNVVDPLRWSHGLGYVIPLMGRKFSTLSTSNRSFVL